MQSKPARTAPLLSPLIEISAGSIESFGSGSGGAAALAVVGPTTPSATDCCHSRRRSIVIIERPGPAGRDNQVHHDLGGIPKMVGELTTRRSDGCQRCCANMPPKAP